MKDKNPANISFKNSKPYSKQFDDIYYSSFSKKQNAWDVSGQPTYAYSVVARFYLQDKLTNTTRVVD
mgnify:CR=1 FL=1